jgi:hypothetical protein
LICHQKGRRESSIEMPKVRKRRRIEERAERREGGGFVILGDKTVPSI